MRMYPWIVRFRLNLTVLELIPIELKRDSSNQLEFSKNRILVKLNNNILNSINLFYYFSPCTTTFQQYIKSRNICLRRFYYVRDLETVPFMIETRKENRFFF